MNDLLKNVLLWVVIAVILMSVFNNLSGPSTSQNTLSYSEFLSYVQSGQVENALIEGQEIRGNLRGGKTYSTYSPETDNRSLIGELQSSGVNIHAEPPERTSLLTQLFINSFCLLYTSPSPRDGLLSRMPSSA